MKNLKNLAIASAAYSLLFLSQMVHTADLEQKPWLAPYKRQNLRHRNNQQSPCATPRSTASTSQNRRTNSWYTNTSNDTDQNITPSSSKGSPLHQSLQARRERMFARQERQHGNEQQNPCSTPKSTTITAATTISQSSLDQAQYHHDIKGPKYGIIYGASVLFRPCACLEEHHPNKACTTKNQQTWKRLTIKPGDLRVLMVICPCSEQHNPTQPCQPRR